MVETVPAKNDPTIANIGGDTVPERRLTSIISNNAKHMQDAWNGGKAQPVEPDYEAPRPGVADYRQRTLNMSHIRRRSPVMLAVCNREVGSGAAQFGHACAPIQFRPRRLPSLLKSPAAGCVSGQGY